MPAANPKGVDDYIAHQPEAVQRILNDLRQTIKAAAPEAQETLIYQLPAYTQNGHLVGFSAAAKDHCSLFLMSPALATSLKEGVKPHKMVGATLHFSVEQPLPAELVTKIVKLRVAENTERAATK